MTTEAKDLHHEATKLADCLAKGHHYASVHLARLINADTDGALQSFAAALGAQIQSHLQETGNSRIEQNRLEQLDADLYQLMRTAAIDWDNPGHRETSPKPNTITCQAIRINGQRCNAPVTEGSRLCRYHQNHESDR